MAITINKSEDGTYNVRVWSRSVDIYGKRKTKYKSGIKTVTAAKKWAELTEDELTELAQLGENKFENNLTFADLNSMYLKSRENKMSPTSYAYALSITPTLLSFIGQVKIENINTRIVQDVVDKLSKMENKYKKGQRLKKGTIQRYVNHIKAVISWGVAQDYIEYNRIKKIEIPEDEEEFEPTTLSAEDVGKVLTWLKTNYYNLYIPVLLSVTMSPRRGEFLGLTWDKIDFENDTINFSNNRIMVGSKIVDKQKMKTRTSKRVLVMSDFVKKELLEHKKMCEHLDSPYVCANVFTGEQPTQPNYISRYFHRVMDKEFGVKMRVHDLRHSFNQIAYEDDVDEATRSKIMGHSKITMTRNTYTKSSLKKNKEAMNSVSSKIEMAFTSN